jgi:hypothetical protein
MQVVMYLGADTKEAAYTAFSKRANVLMLEGWELDPYGSSDTVFAVRRDRESRVLEVTECWDQACLASRPPSGLPESSPTDPIALERLPDATRPDHGTHPAQPGPSVGSPPPQAVVQPMHAPPAQVVSPAAPAAQATTPPPAASDL